MMEKNSKDQPIRSVSRALHVLQAINRHGALTLTEISRATSLPFPTTCRIVSTLMAERVIERETSRKYYRPTALAQSLSCGYQPQVRLVAIARQHIEELTRETGWPVSLTSRVGPVMVIQDSTHAMTTQTFSEYHPGFTLPIISSASGLIYLAHIDKEERQEVLRQIKESDEHKGDLALIEQVHDGYFESIKREGYASFLRNPHTKDPGKTSSIALPLFRNDVFVGSLTMIFFASTMGVTDAFERYKEAMVHTQEKINHDLNTMKLFKQEDLVLD